MRKMVFRSVYRYDTINDKIFYATGTEPGEFDEFIGIIPRVGINQKIIGVIILLIQ